jgi:hypothetical protein
MADQSPAQCRLGSVPESTAPDHRSLTTVTCQSAGGFVAVMQLINRTRKPSSSRLRPDRTSRSLLRRNPASLHGERFVDHYPIRPMMNACACPLFAREGTLFAEFLTVGLLTCDARNLPAIRDQPGARWPIVSRSGREDAWMGAAVISGGTPTSATRSAGVVAIRDGAFPDLSRIIAPLIMGRVVAFHTCGPHRSAGAEDSGREAEMRPTITHHATGPQAIVAVHWECSR